MSQFEIMMNQLRKEYLTSLPQKLIELESSFQKKDLSSIREDFHKLKGTGKTYGFPEISELGEVVERLLDKHSQCFHQIVPDAIDILKDIHRARTSDCHFDLETDGRFNEIRDVEQTLK